MDRRAEVWARGNDKMDCVHLIGEKNVKNIILETKYTYTQISLLRTYNFIIVIFLDY
jgi:hypothetical protein